MVTPAWPGHIFVLEHKTGGGDMFQAMAGSSRAQDACDPPGARSETTREVLALRNLVAVYRHLSGLAVQNADIAAVTQLIAEQTHATVAIVSPTMDILTAAAPGETGERAAQYVRDLVIHPRLGDVLGAASRARRALRLPDVGTAASVTVAPVLVGDDVPAYLLTLDTGSDGTGEDTSLLLTEHAATICGVILGRERVVAAAASRIRDDLVEGLLSGRGRDLAETGRWATHLGYDPGHDHHVLSIALDAAPGVAAEARLALTKRAAASAESFLATRAPDAIISVRDTEVAVVLPARGHDGPGSRARKLGTLCVSRLGELFGEVAATVGIGGPCRGPSRSGSPTRRPGARSRPSAGWGARAGWSRSATSAFTGSCCRSPIWPNCAGSPTRCSVAQAPATATRPRCTWRRWPATSGRTPARSGPPGCCTFTPTRSPTGSAASRRSPALTWAATGTG